ncbi:hypothetical protein GCM10022226_06850 [Sphaerisporangium flaviroseum]|uniref:Uncharacterized protein n=1 Tax=Sphaerisporangium flaviroseum TaxID=509199 RepID=A0ABP7HFF6_9ACTN
MDEPRLAPEPPWTAEQESAMVNGFDDGMGISELGQVLGRHPARVRARLHLFGRLPACDPVRAAEDLRLLEQYGGPADEELREVLPPEGTTRRPSGLLRRFLR